MPEHPTLRIHSPRPDILDVADTRRRLRFMERTCLRLSGLMIVSATFLTILTVIMNDAFIAIGAFFLMFLAYFFQEISQRLRDTHESTPTRDDKSADFA